MGHVQQSVHRRDGNSFRDHWYLVLRWAEQDFRRCNQARLQNSLGHRILPADLGALQACTGHAEKGYTKREQPVNRVHRSQDAGDLLDAVIHRWHDATIWPNATTVWPRFTPSRWPRRRRNLRIFNKVSSSLTRTWSSDWKMKLDIFVENMMRSRTSSN